MRVYENPPKNQPKKRTFSGCFGLVRLGMERVEEEERN